MKIRNWNQLDHALKVVAATDVLEQKARALRDRKKASADEAYSVATNTEMQERAKVRGEIEEFARAHKDEITADGSKSMTRSHGRISFKQSPPSLALLGKKTWDDVLAAVKSGFKGAALKQLVTTTESVSKTALKKLDPAELKAVGLETKNPEKVVIETYPEKAARAA